MRGTHRYELKFLVNSCVKNELLKAAATGLQPDPFGDKGVYRVSSQYFDSPDRCAYWEKLDGVAYRSKFRLRFYGQDPKKSAAFFEIKHRADQTVCKERIPLSVAKLPELLQERSALLQLEQYLLNKSDVQSGTFRQISLAAAQKNLEGVTIITYLREAWIGLYDHRLRVTFDHVCQAYEPGDRLAPTSGLGTPFLDEKLMVLEVKFDKRLPVWLRDCLSTVAVRPIRFSKYAEGLEAREDLGVRALVGEKHSILNTALTEHQSES